MKSPMEHLKQWHSLYRAILTPSETALYIEIFMIGNSRFWPKEIELTDSQLSLGTNIGIKRIPTVINALVQKGLITSERGKGKSPSKYKICPLSYYPQTGVINEEKNERKTRDKSEINERYIGDKREINERLAKKSPSGSKAGEPSKTQHNIDTTQHIAAAATRAEKNLEDVIRLFEDSIHPISNMVEKDALMDLIETDGYERVKDAIREAAMNRARSVKYIAAILGRWRKEGAREKRSSNSGTKNPEFAEQCRLADERQVYPWEVRPAGGGAGGEPSGHSADRERAG